MKPAILTLFISVAIPLICVASPEPGKKPEPAATRLPVVNPSIFGSSWLVEDIGGGGVIDNARTFVHFDSAEKVSGSGGINRFSGPCTLQQGNKLSFGPLASTRMAGPPALMDQESRFFVALAEVAAFRLDVEKDLLHFLNAEGKEILRLSREGEKGEAKPPAGDASGAPDER